MKGHKGFTPFSPGKALLLDVGNTHAVYNKSDEDRTGNCNCKRHYTSFCAI